MRVCVGEGFVSRFFARGCVRVGACACACARVGGVGCKAAGAFARGCELRICTIHHEHKEINHEHKEVNGLGYLSASYLVASFLSPSSLHQVTSPQVTLQVPSPSYPLSVTLLLVISFGCSCGISLTAVEIIDGVGVWGGGVFLVWCFSARLGNGLFFGRFPSLAVPCPIGTSGFVYQLARLGVGLIHAFRCWIGSIGFI